MLQPKSTVIIISFIGSMLILGSAFTQGLGLSPDSIAYLAASNNLLQGNGLLSFDGLPLIDWPPFYSLLLFLFSYPFNISSAISAIFLNSILFGMTLFFTGRILLKFIDSNAIIILGMISIMLSIPLISIALWVWSELLFILLSVLYIYYFICFLEENKLVNLMFLGIISSLLPVTRYIGIVFIPLAIVILIYIKPFRLYKSIASITAYLIISLTPFVLLLFRNHMISGTFFGRRGSTSNSLLSSLEITVEKIMAWFLPDPLADSRILFLSFIIISLVIFYKAYRKKSAFNVFRSVIKDRFVFIGFLFTVNYLTAVILISSLRSIDPIDDRLLSPVFIPVIFLVCYTLQIHLKTIKSLPYKSFIYIFMFGLLLIKPVFAAAPQLSEHYISGSGYSGSGWQKDQVKDWLKSFFDTDHRISSVYTNDPFAVYYLTGVYSKWSPVKAFGGSDEIHTRLDDLNGVWPEEGNSYLLWMYERKFQQRALYFPAELETVVNMELIDSSKLGSIYHVNRKNTP